MLERVDSQLKKELSLILNYELKDPRIDVPLTVMSVDAAKDLSYAKVAVSAYGSQDKKSLFKALNNASGHIRKLLFGRLKIRTVPHFEFVSDDSMDNTFRVNELLKQIKGGDNGNDGEI